MKSLMLNLTILAVTLFTTSISIAQVPKIPLPTADQVLGPWLELRDGGEAVGPAQTVQRKNPDGTTTPWYGSLVNGTLLPEEGEGFVRVNRPETSWGAGIMINLLEKASAYYMKKYAPPVKLHMASIAQQFGGPYGPHKSHQNGLDADIYFVGQTKYESVLDEKGQVTSKFDPQKNWDFWRLLTAQQLTYKGQTTSAVYMILVAPPIKDYLCQWAKAQDLLKDPLNVEVMKRLRPTEGHDTHFHLRLNCSPYYTNCNQQGALSGGVGCP